MTTAATDDQARTPIFRLLMGVQLLSAGFFGLVPLLAPALFASISGFSPRDELVYRLAGAASAGYAVVAAVALAWQRPWGELRIPIVATLTFTAAAAVGCLIAIADGEVSAMVVFVLVAAATFAVLAATWLARDRGPAAASEPAIGGPFRVVLALATVSAAVFGLLPLLAPGLFAALFRLEGVDAWPYRMAGAACLGYATAGVLEVTARGYPAIRLQNAAAVTFNAAAALVAWLAFIGGSGGLLAPVVAVAATCFAIALTVLGLSAERGRSGT